jgi:hypothetical protein
VGVFLVISSQGDDHLETNLANSGYMPDMKVEKNQDPSIFLATYWNLLQKSVDLNFFFKFRNLANLDHFPHEKSFILVKITFFMLDFCKNSPIKKTLVPNRRYPCWIVLPG